MPLKQSLVIIQKYGMEVTQLPKSFVISLTSTCIFLQIPLEGKLRFVLLTVRLVEKRIISNISTKPLH